MRLWSSCGVLAVGLVAFVVLLAEPHAAWGEIPREVIPYDETLQMVLDRIHEHAKDEAWRAPGWKDEKIEAWLEKLVAAVAKGTERPELKLPVRMADLQPADPARPIQLPGKLLIVGGSQTIRGVQNSIILCDGNLEIPIPRDSIVVARGVVKTSGARNCVIVAGSYIGAEHDGDPGMPTAGSLLVSRGPVDVRSANGSTLISGLGIQADRSEGAVFVNQPLPVELQAFPLHKDPRSVEIANLPLEPLPQAALAEKLTLLGTIITPPPPPKPVGLGGFRLPPNAFSRGSGNFTGAVVRFDKQRYVADLNQPIVDQAGQPVEALAGWELTFATDRVALFSRDGSDALVRMHVEAE
jgi:hypothetical protein